MSEDDNSLKNNWKQAVKGIGYLQEGLEDFVEDGANRHHEDLLKRTGVTESNTCNVCTIDNILPEHPVGICSQENKSKCLCTKNKRNRRLCPAGICSKMYDCIVNDHCFRSPLWINSDPTKWCSDPWSIAKVFQTTIGPNKSAKDTDASGQLSIIINDTTFADKLKSPVERDTDQSSNVYCKARLARNDIQHSPKMQMSQDELFQYIDLFCDVLSDIKNLLSKDKPKKAFDALQELKSADVKITRDEKKIDNALQNALIEIEAAKEKAKKDIAQSQTDTTQIMYQRIPSRTAHDAMSISNEYEKRKSEMQKDLIYFNRQHHSTIPLSPLFEKSKAAQLKEFYVIPDLKYVDVHGKLSDIRYQRERENIVSTLFDIFHTQSGSIVNEIYLIANAGFGKTAFCKFLAVIWIHAHEPSQDESFFIDLKQSLDTIRQFRFLFFISLRNATDKDLHIDDMIEKQICYGLARRDSYPREFLQRILTEEKSLIILDGLDEWKCPSTGDKFVPDRCSRQNCTILTTTRTWKFCMLQLRPHEINKKIMLSGIDGTSGKKLAEKVLSQVQLTDTDYEEFRRAIELRSFEELAQNPMIHMFLICLWIDEKSLGYTRCQVYGNILNVLISRTKQLGEFETVIYRRNTSEQTNLSTLYSDNEYCRKYKHFMESLSDLAASTLLSGSKDNSLVFNEQVALRHLSGKCLKFSLAIGVLTKMKIR